MEISQHKISSLKVTLDELYKEQKQIIVHLTDKNYVFNLVLVGKDKTPDFCLSSFKANMYTRSAKGMNRQKYTTLKGVQEAVQRLIDKKVNTKGIISYSLSDEVFNF
jgi:hypothetical protein